MYQILIRSKFCTKNLVLIGIAVALDENVRGIKLSSRTEKGMITEEALDNQTWPSGFMLKMRIMGLRSVESPWGYA